MVDHEIGCHDTTAVEARHITIWCSAPDLELNCRRHVEFDGWLMAEGQASTILKGNTGDTCATSFVRVFQSTTGELVTAASTVDMRSTAWESLDFGTLYLCTHQTLRSVVGWLEQVEERSYPAFARSALGKAIRQATRDLPVVPRQNPLPLTHVTSSA